ncbi:hypothetical protein [Ilumatobacter coccineus]|uniref:Uncharacterized protein n=1 Tax=Ilumatobacter coccineus (strain NBRC 103263 / KCTC 29153 / YM16-304) TaxID=1313172 RepID=A0A6C7EBX1_ILUCY|nr:hypothetical protein [Ilumatobacter coccineus]BAN03971.1 hypothetical protein YM304_36570 [Ilumatobacter coccineus YM16-304]
MDDRSTVAAHELREALDLITHLGALNSDAAMLAAVDKALAEGLSAERLILAMGLVGGAFMVNLSGQHMRRIGIDPHAADPVQKVGALHVIKIWMRDYITRYEEQRVVGDFIGDVSWPSDSA